MNLENKSNDSFVLELNENDSKFIQVYIGEKPHLIFAPSSKGFYHGVFLGEFLKSLDIKFVTFRDIGLRRDIPLKVDYNFNYELVGAGKAYRIRDNILVFGDSSGSYGVGPNLEHFQNFFKDKKPKIDRKRGDIFVYFNNFEISEEKNKEEKPSSKGRLNLGYDSDIDPFFLF